MRSKHFFVHLMHFWFIKFILMQYALMHFPIISQSFMCSIERACARQESVLLRYEVFKRKDA